MTSNNSMELDDEDDFYSPEEPIPQAAGSKNDVQGENAAPTAPKTEELEEGEEEDEGGEIVEDEEDSDVDFIIETTDDGDKQAPPQPSRYSDIKNIPQRSTTGEVATKAPVKEDQKEPSLPVPSADQAAAAASSSKLDLNANPVYAPAGKPIMQVNIDTDLPDNEKPWRKPGTDLSDYFNYGFDEFTWALYAAKQDSVRQEYNADAVAASSKKMMEEFNNMMMMGGMPGMPGGGGASGGMPGMDTMTPEMQQMMQQMMASGMDPSQMDPQAMNAMFQSMQNGGGQAAQGQGQNYQQGGYGGNQQQGYGGYEQGMGGAGGSGGGGGGNRGAFGGRGRGRRNW